LKNQKEQLWRLVGLDFQYFITERCMLDLM